MIEGPAPEQRRGISPSTGGVGALPWSRVEMEPWLTEPWVAFVTLGQTLPLGEELPGAQMVLRAF